MRRPLCMACLLIVLSIAVLHGLHPPAPITYEGLSGQEVCIIGRVYAKEYHRGETSPILYLFIESEQIQVQNQNSLISHKSKFIAIPDGDWNISPEGVTKEIAERTKVIQIGQTVKIRGILYPYESAGNPGQFDAQKYYGAKGIYACINKAKVDAVNGKPDVVGETLFSMRRYFTDRLDTTFPGEDAAILKSLILGDKTDLPEDVKELYADAGILHILAISGLHISLFGMGLYRLLRFCHVHLKISVVICIGIMFGYGMMINMPVSALRAILMFSLRLVAKVCRRTFDMPTGILFAAAFVLLMQPQAVGQAGFLLSFFAVGGICFLKPALFDGQKIGGQNSNRSLGMGEGFFVSLSVFLFSLPIQLSFYFEVSVSGILLNLAVLPLMSILLVFGLLGLLPLEQFSMGPFLLVGAIVREGVHGILLAYEEGCVKMESLQAVFAPGKPEMWQCMLYYLLIGLVIYLNHIWSSVIDTEGALRADKGFLRRIQTGLILGAILILSYRDVSKLQVTILDTGQGDCICMTLPGGETILFDGGSSSVNEVGKYRITPYLKSQGIHRLEMVFLSHSDSDHINGVIELLKEGEIEIGRIVLSDGYTVTDGDAMAEGFAEIYRLARIQKIPLVEIYAGDGLECKGVQIYCLNPIAGIQTTDASNTPSDNASSQVFYIKYGGFQMLLTGDVEANAEEDVLRLVNQLGIRDITILKVAHHGSKNSTSMEFLECLNPKASIISCGKRNRYGHPHEETLIKLDEVGTKIYQTPIHGAVMIETDGRQVRIETFLGSEQ